MRRALLAVALIAGLVPATATAAPLGLGDCGPAEGVYACSGLVRTWDGVPLDVTLVLPERSSRDLPLVAQVSGFSNSKFEYLDPASPGYLDHAYAWARDGYAVLTYTERGLWGSCGTPESRLASPLACADGYLHLADVRYEVRDAQTLIGLLVDAGVADPRRLGVAGESYGGGQAMMLAALRDRIMLPGGRLVRWRSPRGTPLGLAAVAAVIPWTDLVDAAAPNGRLLTHTIGPADAAWSPIGVSKGSFVNGIAIAAHFAVGPGQPVGEPFVRGRPMGYLAPPGTDSEADVVSIVARTDAGEPYRGRDVDRIVRLLERYRSAYHIDPSHRPPPLFIGSGFTDDLFPVDQVVRYANRTLDRYPGLPLSVLLGDYGHDRSNQKADVRAELIESVHAWLDDQLMGRGRGLPLGVTAYTQTCPADAPSGGPFHAPTFSELARGEVRASWNADRAVLAGSGNPLIAAPLDPVTGRNACTVVPAGRAPGTAVYTLPRVGGDGYTLLGAPTIVARLRVSGARPADAQIAGRLWDVAPDGESQRLVARGTYRPRQGAQVWQLHPGAWTFRRGHFARLELLGADAPYARPSNAAFRIEALRLQLRLPVRELPDCRRILPAAAPVLPDGHRPAPGVRAAGSPAGCPAS